MERCLVSTSKICAAVFVFFLSLHYLSGFFGRTERSGISRTSRILVSSFGGHRAWEVERKEVIVLHGLCSWN